MVYSGFGDCVRQRTARTGIGVGIIAFIMGRFVERKKWTDSLGDNAFEVLREKQKS